MHRFQKYLITSFILIGVAGSGHAATTGTPTPPGWLPHFESLIAIAVVAMAGLTALLLNHQNPKLRATGTSLAALSCFGIVVWFGTVLNSGVLENSKINCAIWVDSKQRSSQTSLRETLDSAHARASRIPFSII